MNGEQFVAAAPDCGYTVREITNTEASERRCPVSLGTPSSRWCLPMLQVTRSDGLSAPDAKKRFVPAGTDS